MGFVDLEGRVVVEPQYEMIGRRSEYRENWYLVTKDGFYGFIDTSGQEVVKPIYEDIEPAKEKQTKLQTDTIGAGTVQFKND